MRQRRACGADGQIRSVAPSANPLELPARRLKPLHQEIHQGAYGGREVLA